MGRAMPAKSNVPIRLPHDGPLFHGAITSQTTVSWETNAFISSLAHAATLKDQLVTIQSYQRSAQQQPSECSNNEDPMVYQILLEWLVSSETPTQLRRALSGTCQRMQCLEKEQVELVLLPSFYAVDDDASAEAAVDVWKDPLLSFDYALSYSPLQEKLDYARAFHFLTYQSRHIQLGTTTKEIANAQMLDRAVQIATLVKQVYVLQSTANTTSTAMASNDLCNFLWQLYLCPALASDQLAVVAVAYARTQQPWTVPTIHDAFRAICTSGSSTSSLQSTTLALGITATFNKNDTATKVWNECLPVLLQVFQNGMQQPDPNVRFAAIQGFKAIISQCQSDQKPLENGQQQQRHQLQQQQQQQVVDAILPVVLHAWENAPTKKLANSIPSLFASLIQLVGKSMSSTSMDALVHTILQQPRSCKGRYVALETLLPLVGAHVLLQQHHQQDESVVDLLLRGIADHGHNTVVIADLWAKFLAQLLVERNGGIAAALTQQSSTAMVQVVATHDVKRHAIFLEWLDIWIPSLAQALVCLEASRRKQVASFCLRRIRIAVGGHRSDAATAFVILLRQVRALSEEQLQLSLTERETTSDRILWAECEIVAVAKSEGLLRIACDTGKCLASAIVTALPEDRLRVALMHFLTDIRSAGFVAIEAAVAADAIADSTDQTPLCSLQREARLWRSCLPLATKGTTKEFLQCLLGSLLSFIDRLCLREGEAVSAVTAPSESTLPVLLSFVVDFLLLDLFGKKTSYPGASQEKESFALSLMQCIIVFVARDQNIAFGNKLLPKNGAVFQRRRHPIENATVHEIRKVLLGAAVLSSVVTLLHSVWDHTRSSASSILRALVLVGKECSINLPAEYLTEAPRLALETRSLYLASSPRQREADTGARSLALLFLSAPTYQSRLRCFERLVDILKNRLAMMKEVLGAAMDDKESVSGTQLPLAHGVIQAIRMIIDDLQEPVLDTEYAQQFSRLTEIFCQSLQISLSVVADIRDEQEMESADTGEVPSKSYSSSGASKVNPGAIGANGTFASVSRTSHEEHIRCIASQRIVVGSWLLTKETCEALPSVLSFNSFKAGESVLNDVGQLLLSTLISVKHTGAAYAAHNSLQKIATACLASSDVSILELPQKWMTRLLAEISEAEKVRNSTLRRSTGYGLGFLALARADISSHKSSRLLCRQALTTILTLSMPPKSLFHTFLKAFQHDTRSDGEPPFSFSLVNDSQLVDDGNYLIRTRVHALNILRLVLLDAPLAQEVFPAAGDAISSAILGYMDTEWAVLNSATMVFASAMLRVVDSNKNASNIDQTSSRAITITELFRSYPYLPRFLLAVLDGSVTGTTMCSHESMSLPPTLPILILLSRVQPVRLSGSDASAQAAPFLAHVVDSLKHRQLIVRKGAARAYANLASSGDVNSPNSTVSCVNKILHDQRTTAHDNWNEFHGALLAIKELVLTHDGPATDFGDPLVTFLVNVVDTQTPPVCHTTALEILAALNATCMLPDLEAACVGCVKRLEKDQTISIGASELATTVGTLICKHWSTRLWDVSDDNIEKRQITMQLSGLLSSPCFDIRLASVKAFKKTIYSGLEALIAAKAFNVVRYLVDMFLDVLGTELSRDESLGAYPPTLRRLSRCLLESLEALDHDPNVAQPSLNSILRLAVALQERHGDLTALTGIALELLSFVIRDETKRTTETMDLFTKLLVIMSHSSLSWKLRHSAAVSITSSRVLFWAPDIAFSTALKLMQDADLDVRYAVSNAFYCSASFLPTPERILHQTKLHMNANSVGRMILAMTDDLEELVDVYVLDHTANDELNLASNRKLFEDEDPNSYAEPALLVQWLLLSLNDDVKCEESLATALHARCQRIWQAFRVALSVTHERKLFAMIQCLFLADAVIVRPPLSRALLPQSSTLDLQHVHPLLRPTIQLWMRDMSAPTLADCCFLVRNSI
jgi:hypothetical protein